MAGAFPSGKSSLGTTLLAGHMRVACPAAAMTAVLTGVGIRLHYRKKASVKAMRGCILTFHP
jgi:hypothetical protein